MIEGRVSGYTEVGRGELCDLGGEAEGYWLYRTVKAFECCEVTSPADRAKR